MKPTRSELTFMKFISAIDFGLHVKIHPNHPFKVNEHVLFPDFRLEPVRLIIEIDGSVHWSKATDRDCKRDFWFEERGYKTLHISNAAVDVMTRERFAELLSTVYPTFPHPDAEMQRNFMLYRERKTPIKTVGDTSFVKVAKKKLKRHEKHLLEQHLAWKKQQGNVDFLPDRQRDEEAVKAA